MSRRRGKQHLLRAAALRSSSAAEASAPWWRPCLHVEWVMFGAGVYVAAVANHAFYAAVAQTGAFQAIGGWFLAVGLFLAVAMTHTLLLALVPGRWLAKLVVSALLLAAAIGSYAAPLGHTDADVRALRPGLAGVLEGLQWSVPALIVHVLLLAGLPIAATWCIRLARRTWSVAAAARVCLVIGACGLFLLGVVLPGHAVEVLQKQHPQLARLVTPLNLLVALVRTREDASVEEMRRAPARPPSTASPAPDPDPAASTAFPSERS